MKNIARLGLILSTLAVAAGAHALSPSDYMGDLVAPEGVDRVIVIQPTTRNVNVTSGETVRFVENGQTFAVHFDGLSPVYRLNDIAPQGSLDHAVMVYIAPVSDGD